MFFGVLLFVLFVLFVLCFLCLFVCFCVLLIVCVLFLFVLFCLFFVLGFVCCFVLFFVCLFFLCLSCRAICRLCLSVPGSVWYCAVSLVCLCVCVGLTCKSPMVKQWVHVLVGSSVAARGVN